MMTLRRGSRGPNVRALQTLLEAQGLPIGLVDGVFGRGTEGGVIQFQLQEAITADGIAGRETMGLLTADSRDVPPEVSFDSVGVPDAARRCMAFAVADIGKSELHGTNTGPEIAHLTEGFNSVWHIDGPDRAPWCAKACSVWVGQALGLGNTGADIKWSDHPFGRWFGSVLNQIHPWADRSGVLLPPEGPAPASSIFIMRRNGSGSDTSAGSAAGHCGIVIKDHGDTVTTVDGNVSNRVRQMTRKKSDLTGYVVWY